MAVPASEEVHADMASALANLHTMAGWTCVDSGFHDQARACFATAMDLAKTANDDREMASAFRHAGIQMCDSGAYNDGLRSFQLGLMANEDPEATAWLHGETGLPYVAMGHKDHAVTAMKKAREQPLTDPFDSADMDYVTSCVYVRLGKIDAAESLTASSVQKWDAEGVSKRDRVEADIMLATIHATAGEPDTVSLARKAIAGVAALQSVRVRQVKMLPLAQSLEKRPNTPGFRDLAVQARRVMQSVRPLIQA
jgi:hypothetical protein